MKMFSFETQQDVIHVMLEDGLYYFLPNKYIGKLDVTLYNANSMTAVYAIMENVFEVDMSDWFAQQHFQDDLREIIES